MKAAHSPPDRFMGRNGTLTFLAKLNTSIEYYPTGTSARMQESAKARADDRDEPG